MNRAKRCLINFFLVVVVVVLCVDTLPAPGEWRRTINRWAHRDNVKKVDPNSMEDWLSGEDLFGPDPEKTVDESIPAWLEAADRWHAWAHKGLHPVLVSLGIWQGRWTLFAPEPDSVNKQLIVTLHLEDGTMKKWRSLDGLEATLWGRLRDYRRMEYFDNMTNDLYLASWKPFADYIRESQPKTTDPNKQIWRVSISYRQSIVPDPEVEGAVFLPVGGVWYDEVEKPLISFAYENE